MKKVQYGFLARFGKYANVPVMYTGNPEQANALFRKMCEARDYIEKHPDETVPVGSLREATILGATYYYNETGCDDLSIEIVPPTIKQTTNTTDTNKQTTEQTTEQTEQTTETTKTHKKTTDTTEKRFKRIFAELARIKEDLAELQMKR